MVRWACLLAAFVLVYPLVPMCGGPVIVPALSPFSAIGMILVSWSAGWMSLLALPILIAAILRRRVFCRWCCPVGLLCDCAALGRRGRRALRWVPRLGPMVVWGTLGGAAFGLPVLLSIDPLAIFSAAVGHSKGWWFSGGLLVVVGASLLIPGIWCFRVCPLGALQDVVTSVSLFFRRHFARYDRQFEATREQLERKLELEDQSSTFVLAEVLAASDTATEAALAGEASGPNDASETQGADQPKTVDSALQRGAAVTFSSRATRRTILSATFSLVAFAAGAWLGKNWSTLRRPKATATLRPPGVRDLKSLLGLCIRCGNCVAACPSRIIDAHIDFLHPLELGTPEIRFGRRPVHALEPRRSACRPDCTECGDVCPSGAIPPMDPEKKLDAKIGVATVDVERCLLWNGECPKWCQQACPYGAIKVTIVYDPEIEIDPSQCNGCGMCVIACPANRKRAEEVAVASERSNDPGAAIVQLLAEEDRVFRVVPRSDARG